MLAIDGHTWIVSLDFELGGRMGLDDTTMLYKIDSVVFYGEVNSCRLVSTHIDWGELEGLVDAACPIW